MLTIQHKWLQVPDFHKEIGRSGGFLVFETGVVDPSIAQRPYNVEILETPRSRLFLVSRSSALFVEKSRSRNAAWDRDGSFCDSGCRLAANASREGQPS